MHDPRLADVLARYETVLTDIGRIQADIERLADSEDDPERRRRLAELAAHGALQPPPFLTQTFRTLALQADRP